MKRGSDPLKVQQWTSRFERFKLSGLTVASFCRSEGVSQPSFYQWKKKLADQPAAGKRPPAKTRGQAAPVTPKQPADGAASGSFQTVQLIGTTGRLEYFHMIDAKITTYERSETDIKVVINSVEVKITFVSRDYDNRVNFDDIGNYTKHIDFGREYRNVHIGSIRNC